MDGKAVRLAGDYDVSSFAFRPPLGQEILFRGVGTRALGKWEHRLNLSRPTRD